MLKKLVLHHVPLLSPFALQLQLLNVHLSPRIAVA